MASRLFNIVLSIIGLLLLSPVLAILALAIKLQDGGPILYRGRRVGRDGKEFLVLKFRSMKVGADKSGPALTTRSDERVTTVGRLLRRFKLDELPQLWNVLVGEMNLVGPRPEDPRYIGLYNIEQQRILQVPPGVTSPASLCFKDESDLLSGEDWEHKYTEEILPRKIEMDLKYFDHNTIWTDVSIILRTVTNLHK